MLAYTPAEYNCLEALARLYNIPASQNQFIENFFNSAPATNTNSAFTGSYSEDPIWYEQLDLKQIRILRGDQPIVDSDAADNCWFYVTTMKAI